MDCLFCLENLPEVRCTWLYRLNALYISMMQRGADQCPLLSVCTVLNRLGMERLFQVQVPDRRWR
ncbi:MAG TPA: hypothetical protein DEQ55_06450 [Pseudomonas sp.]|nr:hypothetical protein [Pseudomonas sp.]